LNLEPSTIALIPPSHSLPITIRVRDIVLSAFLTKFIYRYKSKLNNNNNNIINEIEVSLVIILKVLILVLIISSIT
jgi:hypothetical protein